MAAACMDRTNAWCARGLQAADDSQTVDGGGVSGWQGCLTMMCMPAVVATNSSRQAGCPLELALLHREQWTSHLTRALLGVRVGA